MYPPQRVRPFPLTRHSVLDRIRSDSPDVRHAAFETLADAYWKPCYTYLRLQWRLSAEDAEDGVQAFFAVAFEKQYFEAFDPAKARFRTFVRTCLDRFTQHEREAASAMKRGGALERLSLDFPGAERELARHLVAPAIDPDDLFRDEAIRALFARAVEALRRDLDRAGRARAFEVFSRHDLADDRPSYAAVAAALGVSVAQVTNDLHHARRSFRDIALAELRAMVATEEEFRAEARDLFGFEVTG